MTSIAKRLSNWFAAERQRMELDRLGETEVDRLAADSGLSSAELRHVSRLPPDSAELLPRRLEALHLSEAAHAQPAVLRDMERLCSACRSKGRCERDLDRDPLGSAWEGYCPNAPSLKALE